MRKLERHPIFFCFCGPTGCGKTTITKRLLGLDPSLQLSISTTTRPPRVGEVDGREYYFVDREEFESRVSKNCFVEHADVSGHRYGTERINFERCATTKTDLLLDIEYQGADILRREYGAQVVVIFVFPPSFRSLEERVISRHEKDSPERIAARMVLAKKEIEVLSSAGFSDYLLVNDFLDSTLERALAIIRAEQMRLSRFPAEVVRELTEPA